MTSFFNTNSPGSFRSNLVASSSGNRQDKLTGSSKIFLMPQSCWSIPQIRWSRFSIHLVSFASVILRPGLSLRSLCPKCAGGLKRSMPAHGSASPNRLRRQSSRLYFEDPSMSYDLILRMSNDQDWTRRQSYNMLRRSTQVHVFGVRLGTGGNNDQVHHLLLRDPHDFDEWLSLRQVLSDFQLPPYLRRHGLM